MEEKGKGEAKRVGSWRLLGEGGKGGMSSQIPPLCTRLPTVSLLPSLHPSTSPVDRFFSLSPPTPSFPAALAPPSSLVPFMSSVFVEFLFSLSWILLSVCFTLTLSTSLLTSSLVCSSLSHFSSFRCLFTCRLFLGLFWRLEDYISKRFICGKARYANTALASFFITFFYCTES